MWRTSHASHAASFLGRERRRRAAVGCERAVAGLDDGDDDAGRTARDRPEELDAVRLQLARDELSSRVISPLRDARRVGTELRRPRGDVRRLSAGTGAGRGAHVPAGSERLLKAHDHVEQNITKS